MDAWDYSTMMNEIAFTQLITVLQKEMGRIRDAIKEISYASAVTTAPDDATYVAIDNTASLSNERALAVGSTLTLTDAGAGSTVTVGLNTHTHQSAGTQGATLDHGLAMTAASLLDDDHTQYRLESVDHTHQSTGAEAGQLDHGLAMTGLGDNDHPYYEIWSFFLS